MRDIDILFELVHSMRKRSITFDPILRYTEEKYFIIINKYIFGQSLLRARSLWSRSAWPDSLIQSALIYQEEYPPNKIFFLMRQIGSSLKIRRHFSQMRKQKWGSRNPVWRKHSIAFTQFHMFLCDIFHSIVWLNPARCNHIPSIQFSSNLNK